jgi:uncharacterized peroxidase-related enzyme
MKMVNEQRVPSAFEHARPGGAGQVRVAVVQDSEATGELAELYDRLRSAFFGFVPDIFKVVSARPEFLRVLVDGYASMFDGGTLDRHLKEVIALTVAREAGCNYCATAHDTLLRVVSSNEAYARAVSEGNLDDPALPHGAKTFAELAVTITRHAHRLTDDDLAVIAAVGWSEAQVLEAIWVACLFNAIVRLADAVGLDDLGQLTEPAPAETAEPRHRQPSRR